MSTSSSKVRSQGTRVSLKAPYRKTQELRIPRSLAGVDVTVDSKVKADTATVALGPSMAERAMEGPATEGPATKLCSLPHTYALYVCLAKLHLNRSIDGFLPISIHDMKELVTGISRRLGRWFLKLSVERALKEVNQEEKDARKEEF
ncbi:hypothetical protein QR680_006804 [Steinernema hermaphroditum]|uniref:Uncharacterized protein n=1 Tax=Steinernema hermaphroditum TaxID=289476 RepID=A0AA39HWI8_9BILA|nr:hypothetical protein QR680_006804 [Steinernema hermaphroditum]